MVRVKGVPVQAVPRTVGVPPATPPTLVFFSTGAEAMDVSEEENDAEFDDVVVEVRGAARGRARFFRSLTWADVQEEWRHPLDGFPDLPPLSPLQHLVAEAINTAGSDACPFPVILTHVLKVRGLALAHPCSLSPSCTTEVKRPEAARWVRVSGCRPQECGG